MADTDIPFPLTPGKPETQTLCGGGSVIWKISIQLIFTKWQPFFNFFIMADADILFPNCKFSFGSVSPSPHHFIFSSVSTFKYDDVPTLKMFMCGHLCVITFLHLKVYNGWCKFSVGSVFQIFHQFDFPHHIRFSFTICVWLWLKHLCVW